MNQIHIRDKNCQIETNQGIFECDWIIGADGRQSTVAKLGQLNPEEPLHKKVALHCYVRPKIKLPRLGQMHILKNGSYIGINPIDEHEVNFSLVTNYSDLKDFKSPKDLINFWISSQAHLSNQFHTLTIEDVKTIYPITRKINKISTNRLTLIGDASGFIDPLTGEGMTTAILTAKILSSEIKKNSSIQEAFYRYEDLRKSEFLEKEQFNLILQKIIKHEFLCEFIALVLESSLKLRTIFIGIIGNVYSPKLALKKLITRSHP